ncbi:BMP family ABC transporter substrate-binding protein, partial [Brachyspira hampsonii]
IVKEGYTNLGFMGGVAHPAVVRFGYGFVQGADYAAVESKLPKDAVNIKYTYVGNYDPTPENQTLATSWYKSGVQVIFAAAGAAGNSVMSAAENNNGLVIGVDVDQSFESTSVITSAMKLI